MNETKNAKKWKMIFTAFAVVLAIMVPYFIFIFVSHSDNVLKEYFQFLKEVPIVSLQTFTNPTLPSKLYILVFPYIAFGLLGVAILFACFYAGFHHRIIYFRKKLFLISIILILGLLFASCLLFSFAEYQYGIFNAWCKSIKGGSDKFNEILAHIDSLVPTTLPNRDQVIDHLINLATGTGTHNPYPFVWIGIKTIWWITGLQIFFIIFITLRTSFKIEQLLSTTITIQKNEEITVLKNTFNQGLAKKILGLFLIPTEFNISLWTIIFSVVIFAPYLGYTFSIAITSTQAYRFLLYSFIYPKLTRNIIIPGTTDLNDLPNKEYYDTMVNHAPGNFFIIVNLPIIVTALIAVMLFAFIFVMLKKPNLSKAGFISLYSGFLAIVCFGLIVYLYSQSSLGRLVEFWNNQSVTFKQQITTKIFGTPNISYFWVHGNELIASGILSFFFLGALSIIAISHILKIKKQDQTTKIVRQV